MAVASLGLIGEASDFGVSSLVIPITKDVPRSDPAGGGTIVHVWWQAMSAAFTPPSVPIDPAGAIDSAPTDGFYGTCYFTDGKNPYGSIPWAIGGVYYINRDGQEISPPATSSGGMGGLILNPLVGGVDSITLTFSGSADYVRAYAVAYTGVSQPPRSKDFPLFFWHGRIGSTQGTGTGAEGGTPRPWQVATWVYNSKLAGSGGPPLGTPYLVTPEYTDDTPAVYPEYEWVSPGDMLIYNISDINHGSAWAAFNPVTDPDGAVGDFETGDSGAWTWSSPDISTVYEVDDDDPLASGYSISQVYAEQSVVGDLPLVGQDIGGSWAGINPTYTGGAAVVLVAGSGPDPCGGSGVPAASRLFAV